MEPVLSFRGAVALLGRFPALAGVDLDVGRGEIVLIQGPNGAGKTTLLRVCAGLVPVTQGEARVLGQDLRADRRTLRQRVGLLGHGLGLYEELTVRDNVEFWARASRASLDDADRAMARLDLGGRLRDVGVGRLSAGQKRRVALACLLARRPELWLLDEPHAGLDNDARDVLDSLVREAAASGATVLVASHELDRAVALVHRTVVISGGMVVRDSAGTPAGMTIPGDGVPGSAGAQAGEGTPGEGTPGEGTPGEGTPGEGTPGEGTPGEGKPGEGTPVEGTPGQGTQGDAAVRRAP